MGSGGALGLVPFPTYDPSKRRSSNQGSRKANAQASIAATFAQCTTCEKGVGHLRKAEEEDLGEVGQHERY